MNPPDWDTLLLLMEVEKDLRDCMQHPDGPRGMIKDQEIREGSTGEYPLPPEDWRGGLAMIRGDTVRLILLDAIAPRNGALRRLINDIGRRGYLVRIVGPNEVLKTILKRWGWGYRIEGEGRDSKDVWEPF